MLIAKPCYTPNEITDFINAYGEFLEAWSIVDHIIPPVLVLYVKEGKEEDVKRILKELKEVEKEKRGK